MSALEAWVRFGQTSVIFNDADGQEHIVVLAGSVPEQEARTLAEQKLLGWRDEGRAVFNEPLVFVKVT